jgi:CIC family chloride channel protein
MLSAAFRKIYLLIEWIQNKLNKKQFIIFSGILVGLSVGMSAIILKTFVHYIYLAATYKGLGDYRYLFLVLPVLRILLTVSVVRMYFLKGKLEKGLPNIHYAIAKKSSIIPKEQMYAQIATQFFNRRARWLLAVGSTHCYYRLCLWLQTLQEPLILSYKERTLLLACGVAAGIGAAFNAPIAGAFCPRGFAYRYWHFCIHSPHHIGCARCFISKIICKMISVLSFHLLQPFNYNNVGYYVLLGIAAGLVSVYHARMFVKVESIFSKSANKTYLNVCIGGLLLALLLYVFPSLFGEGYESIKALSTLKPENLLNNSFFESYQYNEWFVLAFVGALHFYRRL